MIQSRISRFVCVSVLLTAGVAARAVEQPARISARGEVSLNENWRFKRQANPGLADEPEFRGAERREYSDASWTLIHLPHTWDISPLNPFAVPGHFRGIGWYRRRVEVPREWKAKRIFVEFKGVCQIADVWVNGRPAGRHTGGYASFRVDITDYLSWSGSEVLAVRVDDVLDPDIPPANETNVPVYGGMYRSVSLITTNPVYVSANGTRIRTEQAGSGVIVRIATRLKNAAPAALSLHLISSIVDAEGTIIASLSKTVKVPAGAEEIVEQAFNPLTGAHFWSPDSPYLYTLASTVRYSVKTADAIKTRFGIRFMSHDPLRGFVLNGVPINLHGVNRRQDYGFLGDAVPEDVGERDIRLIKDMGANFLRTSHYPQDPAVLDACDRFGILVWEEVPNIKIYLYPPSGDRSAPTETERFPRAYLQNLKRQIHEMIDRDYNHPAIIIWGFADDLSLYHYPEDIRELSDYTHSLDGSRWTAGRVPPDVTDVADATTGDLLKRHAEHPERPYIWNEWGSFASERAREGSPYFTHLPADTGSQVSMADSAAALLMEAYWMQWNALPWLGTLKWCMFDTGEPNAVQTQSLWARNREGKVALRWPFNDYYGVADMWRIPKEGYYFLQSQWTEKPMVHIVGNWTSANRTASNRTVRVYSNGVAVELFLNGRSLGVHHSAAPERVWKDFRTWVEPFGVIDEFGRSMLTGAKLLHGPFLWDDVAFEPGSVVAVATKGDATVRHEIRTPGAAARIALESELTSLETGKVAFIKATVVDVNDILVPDARPWLHFDVKGPGRILGGVVDVDAISGVAATNVQATPGAGEIIVTTTSPGLATGTARIVAFGGDQAARR